MSRRSVVVVDARNVIRSRWPNIDEERFLALVRAWAVGEDAQVIAVFDGRAPGGRVGTSELDERITVVGTGRESADDWIVEHLAGIGSDGSRAWLVTSDRGLRERVEGLLERIIGGGSYASQLEAVEAKGRGLYYRASGDGEETGDAGEDG